jgi:hypothetical protein
VSLNLPSLSLANPAEISPSGTAMPSEAARALNLVKAVRLARLAALAVVVIAISGLALRLLPCFGVPDQMTADEMLYTTNVRMLEQIGGPTEYHALIENYVDAQARINMVMLPPTRCVYIILGWTFDTLFHAGPQMSLRWVAAIFSVLSFFLSGWFAWRLGGIRFGLIVGALMAVSPVELMLAHRELVDGIFSFWALCSLWLLWENLQRPSRLGWLAAYAGALAFMVLTKENAFFAAIGLGGVWLAAYFFPALNLGKAEWTSLLATITGGALGVLVLISLAGGPHTLIAAYRLLVSKAEAMPYAYQSGGGPWFRYVIDLMLASPAVTLLAIGGIFALRRGNRQGIFLLLFVLFSCAVMVNVRNGMNLRYATMWDMPLRYLAAGIVLQISTAIRRAPILAAACLVVCIAGIELHQYQVLFIRHDIGDPITQYLIWANEIVRQGNG